MRLLIITGTAISVFLALTMVFFRTEQKRQSGFDHWTAGNCMIALGYILLILRGVIPDFLSIVMGNVAFPLAMVLFLEGMRRFLGLSAISRMWYAFPAATFVACVIFFYLYDSAAWRNMSVAVCFAIPHFFAAILVYRHMAEEKLRFYPVIALEMTVASLLFLARAIWVVTLSDFDLFFESPLQHGFFVVTMVLQMVVTISFIMLHDERLEKELLKADGVLKTKVEQLEQALSQVKVLSGLLPICANCKRICDDKGNWNQIEMYIRDRSEADFSHGICPDCARKLYPEFWDHSKEQKE
jgi:hypothetical protein